MHECARMNVLASTFINYLQNGFLRGPNLNKGGSESFIPMHHRGTTGSPLKGGLFTLQQILVYSILVRILRIST